MLQDIARTAGTTVEAVLHALIAQVSPSRSADAESGEAEDAEAEDAEAEAAGAEAAEDKAERRREQEEVAANIRRWHQER